MRRNLGAVRNPSHRGLHEDLGRNQRGHDHPAQRHPGVWHSRLVLVFARSPWNRALTSSRIALPAWTACIQEWVTPRTIRRSALPVGASRSLDSSDQAPALCPSRYRTCCPCSTSRKLDIRRRVKTWATSRCTSTTWGWCPRTSCRQGRWWTWWNTSTGRTSQPLTLRVGLFNNVIPTDLEQRYVIYRVLKTCLLSLTRPYHVLMGYLALNSKLPAPVHKFKIQWTKKTSWYTFLPCFLMSCNRKHFTSWC